jgi:hypothetical protein
MQAARQEREFIVVQVTTTATSTVPAKRSRGGQPGPRKRKTSTQIRKSARNEGWEVSYAGMTSIHNEGLSCTRDIKRRRQANGGIDTSAAKVPLERREKTSKRKKRAAAKQDQEAERKEQYEHLLSCTDEHIEKKTYEELCFWTVRAYLSVMAEFPNANKREVRQRIAKLAAVSEKSVFNYVKEFQEHQMWEVRVKGILCDIVFYRSFCTAMEMGQPNRQ